MYQTTLKSQNMSLNEWVKLLSFSPSDSLIIVCWAKLLTVVFLYEHLCVLHRNLQDECEAAVVEGLVQSDERSMNAALQQVATVLPQTDGLDPVDHLLIGPHQHV